MMGARRVDRAILRRLLCLLVTAAPAIAQESGRHQPHPPVVIRAVRAFAWTALAMGFGMVIWILYAMLFSYR